MEEIIKQEIEKPITLKKKGVVLKSAINIVIYIVIVVGILFGLPKFLAWSLDTSYPMAAITSGSMWPVLKEGDLVFIRGGVKKENLQVGNIIVYRNKINSTLTIHRIVKLNTETLVTKGDANFIEDAPTLYSDVVGKALTLFNHQIRIPYLGSITILINGLKNKKAS